MSATQFSFQAASISQSRPHADNSTGGSGTLEIVTAPVVDHISDAFNNVRFSCAGSGPNGSSAFFTLNANMVFRFTPQASGRLTTHAHFEAHGGFSLVAQASNPWLLDFAAGVSRFDILASARVVVDGANGTRVLDAHSPQRRLFSAFAEGTSAAVTKEGVVDVDAFQFFITQAFPTVVTETDRVLVIAQFSAQALVFEGAEFALDFSQNNLGDGLNAPMAIINIT
jgi:hypothetical protein